MKKAIIAIGILLVCGLGALYLFMKDLERYAETPATAGGEDQVFTISSGQRFAAVAGELASRGIISHPVKFKIIARRAAADTRIKAGEYLLSPSMSPREVLEKLVSGAVRLHRLTIPEGFTIDQIAEVVEKEGLGSAAAFKAAAQNRDTARAHGIAAASLEGYLFPDTYLFPRGTTAKEIVAAMLVRFEEIFTPAWHQRAKKMGLSVHEIVTLASIIEKETGAPAERTLISSVFHNRLKKGMRLETDPTVIYGIEAFDGNLTRAHLAEATPYNTYLIEGLPPGPISNPGKAALEAALYPADTDYLFFVSKNDGTHQFSTRFEEHSRAVDKHQRKNGR